MDSYSVIGIVHSVGEYNGNEYDNYNIHCVRPADSKKEESGQITCIIKVKASLFIENPVTVGDTVTPYYDRFGRVVSLG